jgi:hypothetical protein
MEIAQSLNDVQIRLLDERWLHLTGHILRWMVITPMLLKLKDPNAIYEGNSGELLAVKAMGNSKYLIVTYKEVNRKDGFIITAFISSKMKQIERRKRVWLRQK